MAARESVLAMFPHHEIGVIDAVLESCSNDVETAVETLLAMADGGAAAGSGSSDFGADFVPPPPGCVASEQQIEDDEALARQLQQQLIWEQDYLEQEQARAAGQTPGGEYAVNYPGSGGRVGVSPYNPQHPPEEDGSLSDSLSGIGSAVYSAGAATASAATSLVSGLWSWVSDTGEGAPASASQSGHRRDSGRSGSPTPIELREVTRPAAQDARETEVRLRASLLCARVMGCGACARY